MLVYQKVVISLTKILFLFLEPAGRFCFFLFWGFDEEDDRLERGLLSGKVNPTTGRGMGC